MSGFQFSTLSDRNICTSIRESHPAELHVMPCHVQQSCAIFHLCVHAAPFVAACNCCKACRVTPSLGHACACSSDDVRSTRRSSGSHGNACDRIIGPMAGEEWAVGELDRPDESLINSEPSALTADKP